MHVGEDRVMVADSHHSLPVWCICYPDCWFWKFHCYSGTLPLVTNRWIQVLQHPPCSHSQCSETLMLSDRWEWEQQGIPAPWRLTRWSAWSSSNNCCSLLWETNWIVCIAYRKFWTDLLNYLPVVCIVSYGDSNWNVILLRQCRTKASPSMSSLLRCFHQSSCTM